MHETIRNAAAAIALAFLAGLAPPAHAQGLPPELPNRPTKAQLANDNNLFIALAKKVLKWDEPAEPVQIVGPIYFVGTKGLGAFLITTPKGTSCSTPACRRPGR